MSRIEEGGEPLSAFLLPPIYRALALPSRSTLVAVEEAILDKLEVLEDAEVQALL